MGEARDIVIVGGGICGLATALALHRKGISSIVLEKSPTLRAAGAAIFVKPNGWRALDQLGVAHKLRQTSIPISSAYFDFLEHGKRVDLPIGKGELRCLRRPDLLKALADDLPPETICLGCHVISIRMDSITSHPVLELNTGKVLTPKVVIGCDGINSVVSRLVGLTSTKLFSTVVLRGLTYYEDGHGFDSEFVVFIGKDKGKDRVRLGRMPINHNQVYWFINRERSSLDKVAAEDQELIWESAMESMKDFPQKIGEIVEKSDKKSLHLTELRCRLPWELLQKKLRRGTVTVAGDAMHAMLPFLAQGGSASLEDAVVLGRCLAQKMNSRSILTETEAKRKVEEAFDEYEKERKMRMVWLTLETYLHGSLLETSSKVVKFFILAFMAIFYRVYNNHSNYDCGTL